MSRLIDFARDTANALLAAPLRLFGTVLPIAIGVALLIATASIAETARFQVAADFDALRSTEVRVFSASGQAAYGEAYRDRLMGLESVVAVEHLRDHGSAAVTGLPPGLVGSNTSNTGFVFGVDPGGPDALHLAFSGRRLDFPDGLTGRPALVGRRLAESLGLGQVDGIGALWVEGLPLVPVGTIENSPLDNRILDSLILIEDHAQDLAGPPQGSVLVLDVAPGAGESVAEAAPLLLRPENPDSVIAVAPPDPDTFRQRIEQSIHSALLGLGWLTLVVGLLVAAVAGWTAVAKRTAEFGLHRALGAPRRGIFLMVLGEGLVVGCVGGLAGVSLGVVATVAAAVRLGWNPVVPPTLLPIGFALAVASALLAGLVPAWRASRITPAVALRAGE